MENKVAVIGNADFVMPFSALGLDLFEVADDEKQIIESAREIIEKKYALVVVAENIAKVTDQVFSNYQNRPIPSIVVIPFTTESEGFATRSLGHALKMATGIDILQNQ